MSVSGKHYYRFDFLKSEAWGTMRIEVLAEFEAKCEICGFQSIENDVHHIWYDCLWKKEPKQFAVLCRSCHEKVHAKLAPSSAKTQDDKKKARASFDAFCINQKLKRIVDESPPAIEPLKKFKPCTVCLAENGTILYDPVKGTDAAEGMPICTNCAEELLPFVEVSKTQNLKPHEIWELAKGKRELLRLEKGYKTRLDFRNKRLFIPVKSKPVLDVYVHLEMELNEPKFTLFTKTTPRRPSMRTFFFN